jgi:hypothetical protein
MKLTSTLILALSVLVAASPAPVAEQAKRAVDCNNCNDRYQFCVKVSMQSLTSWPFSCTHLLLERPYPRPGRLYQDLRSACVLPDA